MIRSDHQACSLAGNEATIPTTIMKTATMTDRTHLIAVTGGIGSGKSVICRILKALGAEIYDCDSRARHIMDCSPEIHAAIAREIAPEAINQAPHNGATTAINRDVLAEIVFNDADKLAKLNAIVHSAVKSDLTTWHAAFASRAIPPKAVFVETAILYQSGLDSMVDMVWEVTASPETRIQRAMKRDGKTRRHIEARIQSQLSENMAKRHPATAHIDNDGNKALLPQVQALLSGLS